MATTEARGTQSSDADGVYVVCTRYGRLSDYLYLGTQTGDRKDPFGAIFHRQRAYVRPMLHEDELSVVEAVRFHLRMNGTSHRDHLALYRADGTLIKGGPTSWKDAEPVLRLDGSQEPHAPNGLRPPH